MQPLLKSSGQTPLSWLKSCRQETKIHFLGGGRAPAGDGRPLGELPWHMALHRGPLVEPRERAKALCPSPSRESAIKSRNNSSKSFLESSEEPVGL